MPPSTKPSVDTDSEDDPITQRVVSANKASRPLTTAANSVFDAGKKAKAAAAGPRVSFEKIVVRYDLVKPPAKNDRKTSYRLLIDTMQVGGAVVLPLVQARGFYSVAKKMASENTAAGLSFSFRTLDDEQGGIWRDA